MPRKAKEFFEGPKGLYYKVIWDVLPDPPDWIGWTDAFNLVNGLLKKMKQAPMSSRTFDNYLQTKVPVLRKGTGKGKLYRRGILLGDYVDETTAHWAKSLSESKNYDFAADPWFDLASSPDWNEKIRSLIEAAFVRYFITTKLLMVSREKRGARNMFDVNMTLLIEPLLSKAAGLAWANRKDVGNFNPVSVSISLPFGSPSVNGHAG